MGQGFTKGIPIDVDSTFSANSDGLVPSQKAVKSYVDNGLNTKQDTLTGSESVLLPTRLVLKQNVTVSHTGTLAQTIVFSSLITAGTIDANDLLNYKLYISATNNANVKTVQCYFNTTNNLAGTPKLVSTRFATSVAFTPLVRNITCKNSLTSQETSGTTQNYVTDEGSNALLLSALSIDFSVNQYFIVAFTLTNITDVISLNSLQFTINR